MNRRHFLRLLPFGPPALMEIVKGRSMVSFAGLSPAAIYTGEVGALYGVRFYDTTLYSSLYMYQFGTKRKIPRDYGRTITIPRKDIVWTPIANLTP